jgi:DNA (cytosine-5)-methyltransferase 1
MALGFEQAGFDVLAAVDLDPIHLAAHERNFPLCEPICADIAKTDADDVVRLARRGWTRRHQAGGAFAGRVDCLFGGPSCQGFSVIGPRKPTDPRNALVSQFARHVVALRPRWFVMENVPGLVSPAYRRILEAFYRALRRAGYSVDDPWTLNARDYGVPQERRRVFVVGARRGEDLPTKPPIQPGVPTVADAVGDLVRLDRFRTLRERDSLHLTQSQLDSMLACQSRYVRRLNGWTRDPEDLSDARAWDPTRLTSIGLSVHSPDVIERFKALPRGDRDAVGRLPKLDPEKQAPTLRAGTGRDHGSFTSARPVHYSSPRVISVREAARLHGIPDWFGLHATKWHGFRQVGNAVPPLLARAVAKAIVAAAGVPVGRRVRSPMALGPDALLEMTLEEAASRYGLDPALLPPNVRHPPASGEELAA